MLDIFSVTQIKNMIIALPRTMVWKNHFEQRFQDAHTIFGAGMFPKAFENPYLFFPDDVSAPSNLSPDQPLRMFVENIPRRKGWTIREDLYSVVAAWLAAEYSTSAGATLICEAGYSKPGDAALNSRPNIIIEEQVCFYCKVQATSPEKIADVLRWGRSFRVLGVIADLQNIRLRNSLHKQDLNGVGKLFLCDALQGDSIIVAR